MAPLVRVRASRRRGAGIGCHLDATLEEYPYKLKPARATDPHGRKMPACGANIFLIDLIEFLFSFLIGELNQVGSGRRSLGKPRAPAAFGAGEILEWLPGALLPWPRGGETSCASSNNSLFICILYLEGIYSLFSAFSFLVGVNLAPSFSSCAFILRRS